MPEIREVSLFTAGGSANKGGINFSARKLRGAKLQRTRFEGGKISVHSHLKAVLKPQETTLKIFAVTYDSWSYPMIKKSSQSEARIPMNCAPIYTLKINSRSKREVRNCVKIDIVTTLLLG